MADTERSSSGAATAIVAVVAIVVLLVLVWFVFLNGGAPEGGDGAPDINVEVDPGDAIDGVTE